jgi:3-oxoacyl-[acyl-carrier protein] reductase
MNHSLAGKLALVTGASRKIGIGAAITRELGWAGADVFFTTYHAYDADQPWGDQPSDSDMLLAELKELGIRAAKIDIDLSDPEAPAHLFDTVTQQLGTVDILVNNAAYSVNDTIQKLTADILDRHYAVNVRGMALLCAEFVRRFSNPDGGRIINLSSGQGVGPMPGELAYAATKGAVEAFTVTLSAEVARLGITVNAVDPGLTDTGWLTPQHKAEWQARSPTGRIGQPEDAARLVRFLATDEAQWITGQVLHSRGGL